MSLSQRRHYFLLCLTFKVIHFKSPQYLYDIIHPFIISYDQFTTSQTRNRPFFFVPTKSTRTLDASFGLAAMLSWNKLDVATRNISELNIFKNKIRTMLINRSISWSFFLLCLLSSHFYYSLALSSTYYIKYSWNSLNTYFLFFCVFISFCTLTIVSISIFYYYYRNFSLYYYIVFYVFLKVYGHQRRPCRYIIKIK